MGIDAVTGGAGDYTSNWKLSTEDKMIDFILSFKQSTSHALGQIMGWFVVAHVAVLLVAMMFQTIPWLFGWVMKGGLKWPIL
jgi:uncharacterized membrane protein